MVIREGNAFVGAMSNGHAISLATTDNAGVRCGQGHFAAEHELACQGSYLPPYWGALSVGTRLFIITKKQILRNLWLPIEIILSN